MDDHGGHEHSHLREKLGLLKSPFIHDPEKERILPGALPNLEDFGDRDLPNLKRHDDASTLETFFDLFFAANYTVFTHSQAVTSASRFKAYVGYFCLLWLTWFVNTLYDVRFITDSVFERVAKAAQLGVLVGFAVVAPSFDPDHQEVRTMRTMSVILCISRLVLAVEYGTILYHCKAFKRARDPLLIQVGINLAASAVYLGITFRFHESRSRVFMAWYIISGLEAIVTMLLSNVWEILSFTKTHLMKRMSLLTVLILGDGVISVAENVVEIVEKPDHWNSTVIGIITSATATVYIIFLIYFDWMKAPYLPPWRQQLWTALHLPFNLALVLFMAGFEQFIIWAKIVSTLKNIGSDWSIFDDGVLARTTSEEIGANLTAITNSFFLDFPPKDFELNEAIRAAIENITAIPDSFWPEIVKATNISQLPVKAVQTAEVFFADVTVIVSAMSNAVFESFEIDLSSEVKIHDDNASLSTSTGELFQINVSEKTWSRYKLVFAYGYIASGCALLFMTFMTIVARTTPWKPWPIVRTGLHFCLALGIALVSLLFFHQDEVLDFLFSPWVLPTITFLWLAVLILTHIGNSAPIFFPKKKPSQVFETAEGPYVSMDTWKNPSSRGKKRSVDEEIRPTDSMVDIPMSRPGSWTTPYNQVGQTDREAPERHRRYMKYKSNEEESTEYTGAAGQDRGF